MNVLLFSNFSLPDSCANATRVMSFAQMLRDKDNYVVLCGIAYKEEPQMGIYKGFEYRNLRATKYKGIKSYKRIKNLEQQIEDYIKSENEKFHIDAIILSNIYFDFIKTFIKLSRTYSFQIAINEVEWYEKDNEQFDGLRGKINFIKNRIALKYYHPRIRNIIAISSLLQNYYKERDCNTVLIPTVIDLDEYKECVHRKNDKIVLSYAGSPARKDYIINLVHALTLLSESEKKRVKVNLYGLTKDNLIDLGISVDELSSLNEILNVYGRIPYIEVKKNIASSDYTVLLRPSKRYANAGFPTKVGESMACGTPVIANLTSDLGKCIIDGKTGVVCENEGVEACANSIKRALKINNEQYHSMRIRTSEMAQSFFDYRVYENDLNEFLIRGSMNEKSK